MNIFNRLDWPISVAGEAQSANSSPQPTPVAEKKVKDKSPNRRSGSFEDGNDKEPWKIFSDIRGRLTKKVEEKLEEIKTERYVPTHFMSSDEFSVLEKHIDQNAFDWVTLFSKLTHL